MGNTRHDQRMSAAGIKVVGVALTDNPYRKADAQRMPRWDEAARNWESGWVAEHAKRGAQPPVIATVPVIMAERERVLGACCNGADPSCAAGCAQAEAAKRWALQGFPMPNRSEP